MPVVRTVSRGDKGEMTDKFRLCYLVPLSDDVAEYLLKERKVAISERDRWLGYQKTATQAKDFDTAKFCKQESAEYMKRYRAACLLIPWYCATPLPGDCPLRDTYDFPPEIFPYLEELERSASCL